MVGPARRQEEIGGVWAKMQHLRTNALFLASASPEQEAVWPA